MKIIREYKKSKIGERRYLTFRPSAGKCLLLDREAKKSGITVSSLLRDILDKHYKIKGE